MEIIKYEIFDGASRTACPYDNAWKEFGRGMHVGSVGCWMCPHYLGKGDKPNTIKCGCKDNELK